MNKKGFLFKFLSFMMILGILGIVFIGVGLPLLERNSLDKWCVEEGFDGGTSSMFRWTKSYCNKIDENVITKVEVERCVLDEKVKWCFVNVSRCEE